MSAPSSKPTPLVAIGKSRWRVMRGATGYGEIERIASGNWWAYPKRGGRYACKSRGDAIAKCFGNASVLSTAATAAAGAP